MRVLRALLAVVFAGFVTAGYAAGDTKHCDKLTGAEKEKCLADAAKK